MDEDDGRKKIVRATVCKFGTDPPLASHYIYAGILRCRVEIPAARKHTLLPRYCASCALTFEQKALTSASTELGYLLGKSVYVVCECGCALIVSARVFHWLFNASDDACFIRI